MADKTKTMSPDQMLKEATATTATATTDTPKAQPTVSTAKPVAAVVPTAQLLKQSTAKSTSTNDNVARLEALKEGWLTANTAKSVNVRQIATTFKNMVEHVLNHQDDNDLLGAWRKMFIDYRDTYLSPTQALRGIDKVSNNESVRNKISVAYMLMYELVNPKRTRKTYNTEFAASVLSNPNCRVANGYVSYIVSRMN